MPDPNPFAIVFEKLDEIERVDPVLQADAGLLVPTSEFDEIAELRRLCATLSEPPARYYTGT